MANYEFKLPDIGEGVVEGEVVTWHVSVGDSVSEDDPVVDVMTDKATVTIPSPTDGTVVSLNGEVGDMIAVGSVLIEFDTGAAGTTPVAKPRRRARSRAVALPRPRGAGKKMASASTDAQPALA